MTTQIKAARDYRDPVFAPIPPANPPNNQGEMDRVAAAQAVNQIIPDNAVNVRNSRIKEIFTNAMPNFIKKKLLDQNEAATVQDLCTVVRRQMVFFELCPSDDWSRDAFNEVSSSLSESLVGALTKLTQQEEELKQQQIGLSNRISLLKDIQTTNQNYTRNNQQQYYRGNNRFNNPQRQETSNNGHIAQKTYSKQICYTCGYPNHYARDCNQRKPADRNQQIPYQTAPKNE